MSYLILLFILVLATFNIVSSLSMLLIEKKEDIYTLHSMGATSQTISHIFRIEGLLVSMTGAARQKNHRVFHLLTPFNILNFENNEGYQAVDLPFRV